MDSFQPTRRFWCIFLALCLTFALMSLEGTVVSTALPTITHALAAKHDSSIWVANSYLLALTSVQPLYAQVSDVVGRRHPLLVAIFLFSAGSGLAGGAHSLSMMIAGRTVQGLGAGGISVLSSIIISDLIPLRGRPKYQSLLMACSAGAAVVGPVVGGILANTSSSNRWRWIFYLNLPPSALALLVVALFLRTRIPATDTLPQSNFWKRMLSRVDLIGSALFIPSITAIQLSLLQGGTASFPWSSYKTILPLVLGFLGWAAFHVHQSHSDDHKPKTIPPILFRNRTSATGYLLTLIEYGLVQTYSYIMPVYFQAVQGVSPLQSGVHLLPFSIITPLAAIVSGLLLTHTGRYRRLLITGFLLQAIGCGLLTLLDQTSPRTHWIGFQLVAGAGCGLALTAILPGILAALPEQHAAVANGTFSFLRSFGGVWGVSMSGVVMDAGFRRRMKGAQAVGGPVRAAMVADGAYAVVGKWLSGSLESAGLSIEARDEVVAVYVLALRDVWWTAMGMACLGFCAVFLQRRLELRRSLDTKFGLDEDK